MLVKQLAVLAFFIISSVSGQSIQLSETHSSNETFILSRKPWSTENSVDLVPLNTKSRDKAPIEPGPLYLATTGTAANVTLHSIAYIGCDGSLYQRETSPLDVLLTVISHNVSTVVFYSNTSFCNYTAGPSINSSDIYLYSTTEPEKAGIIAQMLNYTGNSMMFFSIQKSADNPDVPSSNEDDKSNSYSNPVNPSPSTAVAMIILYAITGVITFLFLVIIITGAIRAHRNPGRYGPRNGRNRQSRARGLARAMLDTIPIVKFGEKDPSKPADVELIQEAGTDTPTRAMPDRSEPNIQAHAMPRLQDDEAENTDAYGKAYTSATIEDATSLGPAAAESQNASNSTTEEPLGCSICTDDFEIGQDLRVLPCDHKFHAECVDPWLLNVSGTCPLCRIDLRPPATDITDPDQSGVLTLVPPLEDQDQDTTRVDASRRRSIFRDLLGHRRIQDASTEERLAALRRLRENEQRSSLAAEDHFEVRGRRRLSTRLHETFRVRTQRTQASASSPTMNNTPPNVDSSRE